MRITSCEPDDTAFPLKTALWANHPLPKTPLRKAASEREAGEFKSRPSDRQPQIVAEWRREFERLGDRPRIGQSGKFRSCRMTGPAMPYSPLRACLAIGFNPQLWGFHMEGSRASATPVLAWLVSPLAMKSSGRLPPLHSAGPGTPPSFWTTPCIANSNTCHGRGNWNISIRSCRTMCRCSRSGPEATGNVGEARLRQGSLPTRPLAPKSC